MKQPKFKFGDKVKIKGGFFEGITGRVTDYRKGEYYFEAVRVHRCYDDYVSSKGEMISIFKWIEGDELEKVKGGEKND